jgi:hypothetical protein
MGKISFLAGLGVGYVLGTRAGRERFEQIVGKARQVWESPTVQEAAGVVQAQATKAAETVQTEATKLYDQGKKVVSDKLHREDTKELGTTDTTSTTQNSKHTANAY